MFDSQLAMLIGLRTLGMSRKKDGSQRNQQDRLMEENETRQNRQKKKKKESERRVRTLTQDIPLTYVLIFFSHALLRSAATCCLHTANYSCGSAAQISLAFFVAPIIFAKQSGSNFSGIFCCAGFFAKQSTYTLFQPLQKIGRSLTH